MAKELKINNPLPARDIAATREKDEIGIFSPLTEATEGFESSGSGQALKVNSGEPGINKHKDDDKTIKTTYRISSSAKKLLEDGAWRRRISETSLMNWLIKSYLDEALSLEAEKLVLDEAEKQHVSMATVINQLIIENLMK